MPGERRYVSIGEGETIAEVFARRVAATPDAIAYREFEGATWRERSWREVSDTTSRVAAALGAEGLAPGDRIAIMLRNCSAWVAMDQGAYRAGMVVVPLYVEDRPENFAYILGDSAVRVLFIGGEEHWKRVLEVRDKIPGVKRIVSLAPVKDA